MVALTFREVLKASPTVAEVHVPAVGGKKKPRGFGDCIGKAEKKTLYVSRVVKNADEIIAWAKAQGFEKVVTANDLHVTVAFSRNPVEWQDAGDSFDALKVGAANDREIKPRGDKGAVVLRFDFPELEKRWQEFKDIGCSWDWPGYQPHVTISYAASGMDLSKVEPYAGDIILGPERFDTVDEDWTAKVVEKRDRWSVEARIVKVDAAQRLAFGFFSVVEKNGARVVDSEDDRIAPDELEKAAYGHVLNARIASDSHDRIGVGKLVESVVFTKEKTDAMVACLKDAGVDATIDIPAVAWWGGYYVEDDAVWKAVQDGDYVSFSIGGTAQRNPANGQ